MAYDRVITFRPDTAANWVIYNPVLSQGEGGLETDTMDFKIGDGSTVWTGLPYQPSLATTAANTAAIATNVTDIETNVTDIATKLTGTSAQLSKAWGSFNGTGTVVINDSFNVDSFEDLGTGHYKVNFINNMNNANYAYCITCDSRQTPKFLVCAQDVIKNIAYIEFNIAGVDNGTTVNIGDVDADDINVVIFGS